MRPIRALGRLFRPALWRLKPNQTSRITRAGWGYFGVWLLLLWTGLYQQINLILLTAGLAFGPLLASWVVSAATLRRLGVARRAPAFAFADEPLELDYTLENDRRGTAALALGVSDDITPLDRGIPGAARIAPQVVFSRVPARARGRLRWQGPGLARGRYRLGTLELITSAPFGLFERRQAVPAPGELIVYPRVGQLARRWHQLSRASTETRRGRRHDRTAQQQEYHGLRDYRPGDSPRWIHWRTTARVGQPMVKEFEQQNDQDLAILLDPWLPRSKVTPEQREALEEAIRFAATVCLETCRHTGRRLLLGWTGPNPGVRQGPASVKLLHELLTQLAILRPTSEGQLSALFDVLPPALLREAQLIVIATRPINLNEEAERSARLAGAAGRGLAGRAVLLDAMRGDLGPLFHSHARRPGAEARTRLDGAPDPDDLAAIGDSWGERR